MSNTVLSGIQATGMLHLGNYLGAIKQWLKFQEEYKCFFFLADLHAITVPQDPTELNRSILHNTAMYISCGIDIEKSTIFAQSSVRAHSELAWLLNCVTPIGWLNRMTQFKDKAGKDQQKASLGLYAYPVLMAADILLYNASFVPVGEDQKQHLELTRDIAGAINRKFDQEVLKVPEPIIMGNATRVMSLKDGTKKMSKSDQSEYSRINLIDENDVIVNKISKAQTDSELLLSYDEKNRPSVSNLINIYSELSSLSKEEVIEKYKTSGAKIFKDNLAQRVIETLDPIRKVYKSLIANEDYIMEVLRKGKEEAEDVANLTVNKVKKLFGYPQI